LAVFPAIATSRRKTLVAHHVPLPDALTSGFHRALLASSIFLVAAAVIALRAANTKGEPIRGPESQQIDTEVDRQLLNVLDNTR
jgi:hypothetical protein